jgi:hypothetical protein
MQTHVCQSGALVCAKTSGATLIPDGTVEGSAGYTTHPVVHQWACHHQGKRFTTRLGPLAVVAVGWAVSDKSSRDYAALQRRLLPHAQAGSRWVGWGHYQSEEHSSDDGGEGEFKEQEQQAVLHGVHGVGLLYADQGKLGEAETMYERALRDIRRR